MPKTREALSQPAYDYLLDAILDKKLSPGDRISEIVIADKFGISRTPVRDAMRRLANQGLIDIYPNRFAQVSEYTPKMICEIGTMRLALDRTSVRFALLYGSKADFFNLHKLAQQCFEASLEGNFFLQNKLDCAFHMALTRISQNGLLLQFQEELYLRVLFILAHYPQEVCDQEEQLQHHFQIADALIAQDKETALKIATKNIVSFYGLSNILPDDFYD